MMIFEIIAQFIEWLTYFRRNVLVCKHNKINIISEISTAYQLPEKMQLNLAIKKSLLSNLIHDQTAFGIFIDFSIENLINYISEMLFMLQVKLYIDLLYGPLLYAFVKSRCILKLASGQP